MSGIRNIIFDLGGVILDIDYKRPVDAFKKLGLPAFHDLYSQTEQDHLFDDFEKGKISPTQFRESIRNHTNIPLSDREIDDAWNSILVELREKNVRMLRELRKKYRLFLLSNTNALHEAAYRELIIFQHGSFVFDELFEKIYLSHHLHMRKPDAEIFQFVQRDAGLVAGETIFIDDGQKNVDGGIKAGIPSYFKSINEDIEDFLRSLGLDF